MFPHIRLFGRNVLSWKVKSIGEAERTIDDFRKHHIQHSIQQFTSNYVVTKRKRSPVNVEVSFYEWKTINQMAEHFINEGGE